VNGHRGEATEEDGFGAKQFGLSDIHSRTLILALMDYTNPFNFSLSSRDRIY